MNTPVDPIAETPIDLTVEVRSIDGSSAEFYQADEEQIRKTLRLLASPRLLSQPQLLLGSEQGINAIPCRGIDIILVRTSLEMPPIFPLKLSACHLDIFEVPNNSHESVCDLIEEAQGNDSGSSTTLMEIHTSGGWVVTLKVVVSARGHAYDERQFLGHLIDVPIIHFRLQEGGIGLINNSNVTRVSAWPKPDALPGTTLPLEFCRWTRPQFKTSANIGQATNHEN